MFPVPIQRYKYVVREQIKFIEISTKTRIFELSHIHRTHTSKKIIIWGTILTNKVLRFRVHFIFYRIN